MMKNFHVQFTEKNLTSDAGLVHFGRFIDKIGLNQALKDGISIERGATQSTACFGPTPLFYSPHIMLSVVLKY